MRITREIGIDMGHRVTNHGGKCRNLHGHRYRIEATVEARELVVIGAEEGMVLDFGFLKDYMMKEIDEPCDHGMCLWYKDPELLHARGPLTHGEQDMLKFHGYVNTTWQWGKLYILQFVPTAENLARHWYGRLVTPIGDHLQGSKLGGGLYSVKVWETPNCSAVYKG